MRTTKTLLAALGLCFSATAFGQANDFSIFASDSIPTCSNSISVYVSAGSLPETNGIIYIDWGDGNTEQVSFTTTQSGGQNIYYNNDIPHSYASAGHYTGNVQVWSAITNSYVGNALSFQLLAGDQNSCGYAYGQINAVSGNLNMYVYGVPLDFTDAGGSTVTIQPAAYFYGYYSGLNPAAGPYTVSINDAWLVAHNYTQVTPDQTISTFSSKGFGGQVLFELSCGNGVVDPDIDVDVVNGVFLGPLEKGSANGIICNTSCSGPEDVQVSVTYESFLVPDLMSPSLAGVSNPTVSGNVLTFNIYALQGCEYFNIPFTFPGSVAAGTPVTITVTAAGTTGQDSDPSNNSRTYVTEVLNSYDPNNKLVNKGQFINYNVKEKLSYVINFQNEGNFPALNITVKDTISSFLDLSTFRLLHTSHNSNYSIDPASRVVTFNFPLIDLQPVSQNEPASKGSIMYTIEEMPGLPLNSEIKNTAYIYFDFNPAIITNTTYNKNVMLGVKETELNPLNIYPNPASGKVTIDAQGVKSFKVIDYTGKTIVEKQASATIDVSALPAGLYIVQAATETGNVQQKLVVRH